MTYFSQFFWLCLLLFTFYIFFFNNNNGILGISRILKLRNQLLSHRGNKIRSKDPKNLEDISRKGFSTGLSYINSCLSEVSQWCKTVDYFRKRRRKITLIPNFGEISGSRGMERQILHLISKSSYNTSSSRITCRKNIMLTHVPHGQGSITEERKMEPDLMAEKIAKLRPHSQGGRWELCQFVLLPLQQTIHRNQRQPGQTPLRRQKAKRLCHCLRDEAPGSPYSEPCVNNEDAVSDDPNSVQAIIEQDEVSDDPNSVQAIIEQDEVQTIRTALITRSRISQ
ncbi:hypothetical protein PVAP13_J009834 [Panicum virgatum]|nr:hypothetical protein PVAP13_J009834 [Panicum virgatum]